MHKRTVMERWKIGRGAAHHSSTLPMDRLVAVGYALCMSNLAYCEYSLVLPEERYLIEVQPRNPATGETRGNDELEKVAKEALVTVIGKASDDLLEKLKPNA